MEINQNLFEEFPPEINFWIESFFDRECRLRARLICKKWFQLYNTSNFDIYLPDGSQIDNIVDTFSRCQQPFSLKFHKADKLSTKSLISPTIFYNLTNLTGLEFSSANNRKQWASFFDLDLPAQIQRVEGPIGVGLSSELTNLTYLNVALLKSKTAEWPFLPNLEFFGTGQFGDKVPQFEETKLTALILRSAIINFSVLNRLNKLTNLKVLRIGEKCSVRRDLNLALPNLEELEMSSPNIVNIRCDSTRLTWLKTKTLFPTSTQHTTLKSLTIKLGTYERIDDNHFIGLKSFPNLEELNIEEQENVDIVGNIFQFMNQEALTRLSISLKSPKIDEISSFMNLRELNLVLRQPIVDIEILSNLSNLTRLAVGGIKTPELDWLNRLTNLRALYLDFKSSQNSTEVPLDLAELTNLRTLVITPRTNKVIHSLNKLKNLERLEFPITYENIFHDQWLALTSLSFRQATDSEQVSKLTRLRELDCIVITNDEIVQLTSLQKLTRFICRSTTADSMFLTHLTSLQSVVFSNKISLAEWGTAQPWSYYNAYPDVIRKLPNFIAGPKDDTTLTYCFQLLNQ